MFQPTFKRGPRKFDVQDEIFNRVYPVRRARSISLRVFALK